MRGLPAPDPDPEYERFTVKAATVAARLRAHDSFCAHCSAPDGPSRSPCARRRQLERLLQASRALVNVRHRALTGR